MTLFDTRCLVTGTDSRGMGRAIALALARAGGDLALHWYRDPALVQTLAEEVRAQARRAFLFDADLAEAAAARDMVRGAAAALGGIGIVVCNAGMLLRTAFLDITDAQWDRLHAVNLHGAFAVAQEAARDMVARGSGGRIIFISSTSQAQAGPDIAHYAASKGGIMMLARSMALELAAHEITVNLVAPGTIETDLNREKLADPGFRHQKLALIPMGRVGTPEDVAEAVLYLASTGAAYVTGSTVTVDGGTDAVVSRDPSHEAPGLHEIYAIRFAHSGPRRRSENFLGGDPHDGEMPLDYFVFVVRGASGVWIVDTGFDAAVARLRGRIHLRCPGEGLRLLGIEPADIRHVVLTHLHYDHAGNHTLFPNATFHLQASEMAYATGPCMCHGILRIGYSSEDISAVLKSLFAGRLIYHDGTAELAPGLSLHRIGGHTGGQQVVRVWTRRGWMVLASDAAHFHENLTSNRPFPWLYHVGDMLDGFATLRRLAGSEERIIPGHDPIIMRQPAASVAARGIVVRLD